MVSGHKDLNKNRIFVDGLLKRRSFKERIEMMYTYIKQANNYSFSNRVNLKAIGVHPVSIPELIIYLFSLHTPRNDLSKLNFGRGIRVLWQ